MGKKWFLHPENLQSIRGDDIWDQLSLKLRCSRPEELRELVSSWEIREGILEEAAFELGFDWPHIFL